MSCYKLSCQENGEGILLKPMSSHQKNGRMNMIIQVLDEK